MAGAHGLRGSGRAPEERFGESAYMGLLKPWEQRRESLGSMEKEER